jgi:hypothetical protein
LTALLVATAVCAPAGTGLVLAQRPGMADHLLSAIAAVTFLLMSRSHLDVIRRWSLLSSGTVSAAASLVALRLSHPGSADLLVGVLLATAGSVAWFGSRLGRSTFSPLARRCADVAEGVVLAAVVPTACGALGLYGDLH